MTFVVAIVYVSEMGSGGVAYYSDIQNQSVDHFTILVKVTYFQRECGMSCV